MKDAYLKASVLGATDGIITTFAVVAGVVGAGLATEIIIILGIANMVADGVSMGIGDYLGERSIARMHRNTNINRKDKATDSIALSGLVTFGSFIFAGTLPLLPYVVMLFGLRIPASSQFLISIIATMAALFAVGSLRTYIIKGSWWRNGLEMFLVGSLAALIAFGLGSAIEAYLL